MIRRLNVGGILSCIVLLTIQSFAQDADSLKEIRRQIEILTQEIERMKLGEVSEEAVEAQRGLGPAAGKIYRMKKTGVSIAGYGEVVYENYAAKREDSGSANKTDKVDYLRNVVYVGFRFNDWIIFNSEVEFEHAGEEVSVEFGYVELMFSRALNVRAGMVLPPLGIINEKHEPSTFFGTLRPAVERSIIPSTWRTNGIGAYGELGPTFNYRVYIVEGLNAKNFSDSDGVRGGRQNGSAAIAEDLGFTGKVEFTGISDGIIGASLYAGNSGQGASDSLGAIKAFTTLWSIHGEYGWKGLELRALYGVVKVEDAARVNKLAGKTIGSEMNGWYVVAGYDLIPLFSPGSEHYLAPFVQYEQLNTQAAVPPGLFPSPANNRSTLAVGVTYKPHPNVAFKFDYRNNKNKAQTGIDQWNVGVNYLY